MDRSSVRPRQRRRSFGRPSEQRRGPQGRWWKRCALAAGTLAIVALAAMLLRGAISSQETGAKLTCTVARGDLRVTVTEQGLLESAENTEIKCQVRGRSTVIWVIDSGSIVKPGDELVRLDTRLIEEQIAERTKYAYWSRSAAERSKADLARAKLAVAEYEQGTYVSQQMTLEKDLTVAESTLSSARSMLRHARVMAASGYVSELDVEEKEFAVTRAKLDVEVKRTQLDVLKRFTKAEQLETLKGNLAAVAATHKANTERAMADAWRRDRALEEFKHCVVRAEKGGLVIHPAAARWENAPEIMAGAVVHKDQVLLLMPDLAKMQVKVGIHESVVERVRPGLPATVSLPNQRFEGTVASVAAVTRPAGWWTGNEVRYDTIIELPPDAGLRPGMGAEVELLIAHYEDVLTIPVAAVLETDGGALCAVKTSRGILRRAVELGDSNGIFAVVTAGLKEGDQVMLNPRGCGRAATASRGATRFTIAALHGWQIGGFSLRANAHGKRSERPRAAKTRSRNP